MQNLSYENEFDSNENEPVKGTCSRTNVFTERLILRLILKASQKWPIMCMIVDRVLTVNSTKKYI